MRIWQQPVLPVTCLPGVHPSSGPVLRRSQHFSCIAFQTGKPPKPRFRNRDEKRQAAMAARVRAAGNLPVTRHERGSRSGTRRVAPEFHWSHIADSTSFRGQDVPMLRFSSFLLLRPIRLAEGTGSCRLDSVGNASSGGSTRPQTHAMGPLASPSIAQPPAWESPVQGMTVLRCFPNCRTGQAQLERRGGDLHTVSGAEG